MARLIFDIEGDALLPDTTQIWCIATQDADTKEKNFYPPDRLDEAIVALRAAECLIGHNIIGFDLPAIWQIYGKWDRVPLIADTLVISRAMHPERYGGHSLEAWGERLGVPKLEHKDFTKFTPEMKTYCEADVELNRLVLEEEEKEYGSTFQGYKVYR